MKQRSVAGHPSIRPVHIPGFVLSRRIMILSNLLKRAATIRYRRLLDLLPGEWGIIAQLGERAPRNLVDLAASMGLDKAQISRSVSKLVQQGLVSRKPNPDNSREILIALTARGAAAYEVIVEAGTRVNDVLIADLSAEETAKLNQLIDRFMLRAQRLLAEEQALVPSADDGDIADT